MQLVTHLVMLKPTWYLCLCYEYLVFNWNKWKSVEEMKNNHDTILVDVYLAYETREKPLIEYVKDYYDADELLWRNWVPYYREFYDENILIFVADPYLIVYFFYFLHFMYRFFGTWEIFGVNFWQRFARFDIMLFLMFGYCNLITLLLWGENFFTSPVMFYIIFKYYWEYTCFFDPYYHYQEMELIDWEIIFSSIDIYYYTMRRVMLIIFPITAILYALWRSL